MRDVTRWSSVVLGAVLATGLAAMLMSAVLLAPSALVAQQVRQQIAEHEAERAQRHFEAFRRVRLPHTTPHGSACDVTIGRVCYWNDNDDPPLPDEPEAIARARAALRARLDSAARIAPTSDWLAGQRVRYALDANDTASAIAIASDCRATPWWCAALSGLVRHAAGDEAGAAAAFTTALAAMPDTLRCAWLDVGAWLPDDSHALAHDASCAERERVSSRLFWLAAPFLSWRPAAARDEWLARHVVAAITRGTALPSGIPWGDDVVETALRFGWPAQWAREGYAGGGGDAFPPPVVGHEPTPSWNFVPDARALAVPASASPADWALSGDRIPPMRYAPAGIHRISPFEVQLARFRGDGGLRIVAAFGTRDSVFADSARGAVPRLVVSTGVARTTAAVHGRAGEHRGVLVAVAPADSAVVAVEAVDSTAGIAARWRSGVTPLPPDAAVSDLLVGLAGQASVPSTLAAAAPLALASLSVPTGSTLALYWEVYAPVSPHPVTISLRLVPHRAALGARLAHALGIGHGGAPIALQWTETERAGAPPGRAVRLALPAIPAGRYRLELVVSGDSVHGEAARELEITDATER